MRAIKYPKPSTDQLALNVGDVVILDRNGTPFPTKIRYAPYQIPKGDSNEGMWVAFVEGISGYWELADIKPVKP